MGLFDFRVCSFVICLHGSSALLHRQQMQLDTHFFSNHHSRWRNCIQQFQHYGVWATTGSQASSSLCCFLFLSFFPPFSCLPGFEQAVTSSQAHLLARANKTRATFPKLNLLLRLSSVNWDFSKLLLFGFWPLICSHFYNV